MSRHISRPSDLLRVLVVSSHGDLGGAPTVAAILAKLLSSDYLFTFILGTKGGISTLLGESGFTKYILPSLRTKFSSFLFLPFTSLYLLLLIYKHRIHIVHCHSFVASLASRLACLLSLRPFVYTVHGWPWRGQPFYISFIMYLLEFLVSLLTFPLRSEVVYVCNTVRTADPFSFLRNSTSTIYNCSKTEVLTSHSISPIHTQRTGIPSLLVLARFSPCKGFENLFRAISLLPASLNFSLSLLGDNTQSNLCHDSVLKYCPNHFKKFKFLGPIQDPTAYIISSDMLLLTSQFEACPLCVLDAMFLSTPSLSMSVGGVPELIVDNSTGYLVPPGDIITFANRLSILLSDLSSLTTTGKKAQAFYFDSFSSNIFRDKYRSIYHFLSRP